MSFEEKTGQNFPELEKLATSVAELISECKDRELSGYAIMQEEFQPSDVLIFAEEIQRIALILQEIELEQTAYIRHHRVSALESEKRNMIIEMCRSI
jgi:hypothetical protein